MFLNYLTLLRQFFVLIMIKTYRMSKRNLLLHFRYYDFFYSGLFVHLLIKFLLFLFLRIQLYGEFNIILLLLSIYICTLIDIYYYIHVIFYNTIRYLFRYFTYVPAEYFYPDAPESEYMRLYLPHLYDPKLNYRYREPGVSANFNIERDCYLLFAKPIFLFLTALRYFIIREPLLFLIIHLFIIVNYLQDLNVLLLYIYLFSLHLSRFLYFISEEYDRFKIKEWRQHFFALTVMGGLFGFLELRHLNPNLVYDKKLIQKFTWNNMNLMLYFSIRNVLRTHYLIVHPMKLSELHLYLPGYYFSKAWYGLRLSSSITTTLYNLCWYIPHIYQDCQKFVKCNQGFWLAVFILFIFFENLFIIILLSILNPEANFILTMLQAVNYDISSLDVILK